LAQPEPTSQQPTRTKMSDEFQTLLHVYSSQIFPTKNQKITKPKPPKWLASQPTIGSTNHSQWLPNSICPYTSFRSTFFPQKPHLSHFRTSP
jgi:hypothetical protein